VKIAPADGYNVLWLHLIRTRAHQDDAAEFTANRQPLDGSQWPAPVIAFYGGAMSADQLLSAAAAAEQERRDHVCEADFFVGLYQAGNGAAAEARPLLQSAAQDCPNDFLERPAATLELQRLGDASPAQMK
jgi:lipoprotein NlpI